MKMVLTLLVACASALRVPTLVRRRAAAPIMELSPREILQQERAAAFDAYEKSVREQAMTEALAAAEAKATLSNPLVPVLGGVAALAGARAFSVGQQLDRQLQQQAASPVGPVVGRRGFVSSIATGLFGAAAGAVVGRTTARGQATGTDSKKLAAAVKGAEERTAAAEAKLAAAEARLASAASAPSVPATKPAVVAPAPADPALKERAVTAERELASTAAQLKASEQRVAQLKAVAASKSSSAAAESSGDLNTPVIGALTLLAAGGTAAGFSQASAAQAEAEETAKKVAGLEKSLAASDSALDDARQATIEVQEAKAKSDKTLSDALAQAKQEASDLATAKAAEAADLTALAESQRKDLTAKAEAAFAQTAELEVEVQAARAEVEALRTTLAAREEDLDLTKKDLADACASGDEMACRVGEVSDELEAAEAKAKTQGEAAAKAKAEAKAAAEAAKSAQAAAAKAEAKAKEEAEGRASAEKARLNAVAATKAAEAKAEEAKAEAQKQQSSFTQLSKDYAAANEVIELLRKETANIAKAPKKQPPAPKKQPPPAAVGVSSDRETVPPNRKGKKAAKKAK